MTSTVHTEPRSLTTFTLNWFNQVADSFERGGHLITQARDDDSGRFGSDGLADAVTGRVPIFGRARAAGQDIVAFDDPGGEFLESNPGRGVAFRDVDELGEITDDSDIHESNFMPAGDAPKVAAALNAAAAAARTGTAGDGLRRVAAVEAADLKIAAFHDGAGVWGEPGASYVALADQGVDVDWDAPDLAAREGIDYTLFDADEADDLADELATAAVAEPPAVPKLPRSIDRLALSGHIPLQPGERLTGSAQVDSMKYSDYMPMLAATTGLQGPQLRVGIGPWEGDDWTASNDGNVAVLDPAAFAEFKSAMAAVPARANQMRAEYAREFAIPAAAKVEALEARRDAIRESTLAGDLSPQRRAEIVALENEAAREIANSKAWPEYVQVHKDIAALHRKYITSYVDDSGETRYNQAEMSPEDRAEYERLRERNREIHRDSPSVGRIDDLHNKAHSLSVEGEYRKLTEAEQAEIDAINAEIHAVWNNPQAPGIDDVLFSGRIPGQWADMRYEVSGSDEWDEDNPLGADTWRLRLAVIPKDAPLDFEPEEDYLPEVGIDSNELAKTVKAFEKVFDTAGAQTAAARPAAETTTIRQIAETAGIPYDLLRGRA